MRFIGLSLLMMLGIGLLAFEVWAGVRDVPLKTSPQNVLFLIVGFYTIGLSGILLIVKSVQWGNKK